MSFIKAKDLDNIKRSPNDISIKDLLFTGYNYVGEFTGEIFDGSTQQLFKMGNVDGNIISHDKEYFLWASGKWNKLYKVETNVTHTISNIPTSIYSYDLINGTINF